MAIQSREEWTREFISKLDAFKETGYWEEPPPPAPPPAPPTTTDLEHFVRTYPNLSAMCIKEGLDLPYRLWLLIRRAYKSQEWVPLEDVFALSCGSKRQTRAWIEQGMGVFFLKIDKNKCLWLRGQKAVCVSLGVEEYGSVDIPREIVEKGGLETFRAYLYASGFASGARRIPREELCKTYGRSKVTLLEWEDLAPIDVQENIARSELPSDGDYSRFPHQEALKKLGLIDEVPKGAKPGGYAWLEDWSPAPRNSAGTPGKKRPNGSGSSPGVVYGGIPKVLCWQLFNSYRSSLKARRSTTLQRQARKAVRNTLTKEPRAKYARTFFPSRWSKGINKALQRQGIAYIREGKRHGKGVWTFQQA